MAESPFLPEHFARLDEDPDTEFYEMPRKVVHIDDNAIEAVKQFFRDTLPADGIILDLMSSWRSHWPAAMPKQKLVGLGMNAEEMSENPDLDDFVIHDINANPQLPFGEAIFDAVVVTVSIQYMTQPVEVFCEVHRILKPGGLFAVIFSNRMFPTKAVAIWRSLNDRQHAELIGAYFHQAGKFTEIEAQDRTPQGVGPTDPLYVVMARKPEAAAAAP